MRDSINQNIALTSLESNISTKQQKTFTENKQFDTAVLFLVFNRPDVTQRVFEAIREAKPTRLYIAADGARKDKNGEAEKVNKVREIVKSVDWVCEVKTLFRDENLGCKKAVSGAIDWFFEHEEQGIILEDDCLPHQDFFTFCTTLLDKYADNNDVWVITGNNFQDGNWRGDSSYYFSIYNHVWGWASWRRAWKMRDMEINFWPDWKKRSSWQMFWNDKVARTYWEKIFDLMYQRKIDTWDYPWTASIWYHGGLTVIPNVNLVSNIGFGKDSTHTRFKSPYAELKTDTLTNLKHPRLVIQDNEADRYTFDNVFHGYARRSPFTFIFLFPCRAAELAWRKLRSLF
jgi:hypothetical protein